MAEADGLGGVDFSQYQNWQQVRTPSGGTYYVVPGTAWVYDPFLSATRGRPVVYRNPTPELQEQDRQRQAQDIQLQGAQAQLEAAQNAASPLGQLAPIAGGVAGTVGGAYLIDQVTSPTLASAQVVGDKVVAGMSNGAIQVTDIATGATQAIPAAGTSGAATAGQTLLGGGSAGLPAAPTGLTATSLPSVGGVSPLLPSWVPPVALAGVAAYTGARGYDAFQAGQEAGSFTGGIKAGFEEAGPLAFVPVLGQLPIIAGGIGGLFGSRNTWKTEKNRLEKLADDGVFVPENLLASMPASGRSKDDLIRKELPADFVGRDSQGNWVNNKFAQSRNVADLRGEDIVNYSAFAKRDPDWFKKPLEERLIVANQALGAGAVKEHHGTIDIDWDKMSQPQASQVGKILGGERSTKPLVVDALPPKETTTQPQQMRSPWRDPTALSRERQAAVKIDPVRIGQLLAERRNAKARA